MSIQMIPVKSSNVRAVGLDVPDKSSEHLIASRILVQFDAGVYECVYKGYGGSTGESRGAYVKAVYERFLVAESKGRFYSEQIRRQADVWEVRKLAGDTRAYVEKGGRVTIETIPPVDQLIDELKASGAKGVELMERQRNVTPHTFTPLLEAGTGKMTDYCGICLWPRKHPAHTEREGLTPHAYSERPVSSLIHPTIYSCALCGQSRLHPIHAQAEKPVQNYQGIRRLVLTVGLPRSGKSSWARTTRFPVVSPDAIRLALHNRAFEQFAEPFVWAQARLMVRALFLAGHETVILDACNVSRARRDEWRGSEWETFCQVFEATRVECRERVVGEMVATTPLPTKHYYDLIEAIDRMAKNFEPLGEDEARYEGVRLDLSPLAVGAFMTPTLPEEVRAEEVRAAEERFHKEAGELIGVPPREVIIFDDLAEKPGGKGGQS